MPENEHLSLQLLRLKPTDQWACQGQGLCFAFFKAGTGRYLAAGHDRRLSPGDVLVATQPLAGHFSALDKTELAFWSFSLTLEHLYPLFAPHEISLLQTVADGFRPFKL